MSNKQPPFHPQDIPTDARIGVIATRWNEDIVDELMDGCLRRLGELEISGTQLEIHRVPGAFEIPVAARMMARTGRFSAIICLGCVIRGETPHFDYIAGEAARGIQQVAIAEAMPIIFGVLTVNDEKQAHDRIGGAHGHAGERAAEAAVEMIVLARKLRQSEPIR
jgi:6,7-dimethyl-8-ribityllumazine synthase